MYRSWFVWPIWIGGYDPIDGISLYENSYEDKLYYHFITYGFSNLYYDEQSINEEFSKFGFELTFRLKPFHLDKDGPTWVFHLIQNIARYVFKYGNWFEPYHYMPVNGQLRLNSDSKLAGIAFLQDPELGEIETPHGKVRFLQMFGIIDEELGQLKTLQSNAMSLIEHHANNNPFLITDLERC